MKKIFIIFVISTVMLTMANYLISSSTGKIGRTQSGCTCHGTLSAGNSQIDISVSPDIFSGNGYVPENIYTITITVSGGPAGNSGGFNLKASEGTLSNPGINTQISGGEATHTNPNARTWTIDWTAPTASVDSVIFYYAGNAVNANGNNTGDDPTETGSKIVYQQSTSVENENNLLIQSFMLHQNYPNPFNNETTINYVVNSNGSVDLKIFDLRGRKIYEASQNHSNAGVYSFNWNGISFNNEPVASGVYVYLVRFNQRVESRKLLLLK